jgi:hypothetical protein
VPGTLSVARAATTICDVTLPTVAEAAHLSARKVALGHAVADVGLFIMPAGRSTSSLLSVWVLELLYASVNDVRAAA